MSIKTILLHLATDERSSNNVLGGQSQRVRLAAASRLARRFDAVVDAFFIATPVSMPSAVTGRGASYAFLAEATAIATQKAGELEKAVRNSLADVRYSWHMAEGDHVDLLSERALLADLAIVTQSRGKSLEDRVMLHIPDQLPLNTDCPTLVLPDAMAEDAAIGRHVVIAWKSGREAANAVRRALPFLRTAEVVTVLTVDPPGQIDHGVADLMTWLDRQGVNASHVPNIHKGGDVGRVILACTHELGGDLLVMGAYGHSRLREILLGGATRDVLTHMNVPVLMTH